MIRLKYLLKESPDRVDNAVTNDRHGWMDADAWAFGYEEDGDFIIMNMDEQGDPISHDQMFTGGRWGATFPGRLWTDGQVMSFWGTYPTPMELKRIIGHINFEAGLGVNDEWLLDVPRRGKFRNGLNTGRLITIAQYNKELTPSRQHSGGDIEHVKSPLKKAQREVPKGYGSMKLKGNMPQADYRRKRYPNIDEKKK